MKVLVIIILLFQSSAQKIDYSYPPLIAGSSWGNIFQQFYKMGDYDSMIKLTSQTSLNKFGIDSVRKYYQTMNFGYSLKLKSWTIENGYYILNYQAQIEATKVLVRMRLEKGDVARIVLPDNIMNQQFFLYK